MSKTFKIGDLVEILYIGQSSSYFPWTETAVPGIYLGEMEFTHYKSPSEKKTDFCHKVWDKGKVRYIAELNEIRLLASGSASQLLALSGTVD